MVARHEQARDAKLQIPMTNILDLHQTSDIRLKSIVTIVLIYQRQNHCEWYFKSKTVNA